MERRSPIGLLPKLMILFIGVVYFVLELNMIPIGDDIIYGDPAIFDSSNPAYSGWLSYPSWTVHHWLNANGRAANYIAPLLLSQMPIWMSALLNGVVVSLFFYALLKACRMGERHVTAQMLLIAIVALTFPWWDSTLLLDVMTNYVWAMAFGLVFYLMFTGEKPDWWLRRAMCVVFAMVAGMMHEAMSMPLLIGLLVWLMASGRLRGLGAYHKFMLAAFALGALWCTFSPGIIGRALNGESVPDDSPLMLALKSDAWVIVMVVWIACLAMFGRQRLRRLMTTPMLAMAVAALLSMAVSIFGGVVGRSGWFACTYALIFMFTPESGSERLKIGRVAGCFVSALIAAVLVAHYLGFMSWQIKLGRELRESFEAYDNSPDGTIYYDYTHDSDVPWWLLCKPRGVIDNDDFHLVKVMSSYYSRGEDKHYVILPTWVSDVDVSAIDGEMTVGDDTLSDVQPAGVDSRGIMMRDGKPYIVRSFVKDGCELWFATPCEFEPGER